MPWISFFVPLMRFSLSIITLNIYYICVVAGAETLMKKWEIYRINVWTVIKSSFNINLIFFLSFFLCYIGWIRWIQKIHICYRKNIINIIIEWKVKRWDKIGVEKGVWYMKFGWGSWRSYIGSCKSHKW